MRGSIASLWKREYEEKTAVNEISLSVEEGEFTEQACCAVFLSGGDGMETGIKVL